MNLVYEENINDKTYMKIFQCDNDIYILDTSGHKCKGLVQKIGNTKTRIRLDEWYDKKTKRHKGRKNKLFNHMERWFCYMIEKYYLDSMESVQKL